MRLLRPARGSRPSWPRFRRPCGLPTSRPDGSCGGRPRRGERHRLTPSPWSWRSALVAAELGRRDGTSQRATWRGVARAWQVAGQPYREAYARLREAEAAARGGRRDQAARALAACTALAQESAAPLLRLARRWPRLRTAAAARRAAPARLDLTDRESQVFLLLTRAASNRQIARSLFISERTVAVHVSRIFDKLGVSNRTEAAMAAARLEQAGGTRTQADPHDHA